MNKEHIFTAINLGNGSYITDMEMSQTSHVTSTEYDWTFKTSTLPFWHFGLQLAMKVRIGTLLLRSGLLGHIPKVNLK